jgi:hypothetical protein
MTADGDCACLVVAVDGPMTGGAASVPSNFRKYTVRIAGGLWNELTTSPEGPMAAVVSTLPAVARVQRTAAEPPLSRNAERPTSLPR